MDWRHACSPRRRFPGEFSHVDQHLHNKVASALRIGRTGKEIAVGEKGAQAKVVMKQISLLASILLGSLAIAGFCADDETTAAHAVDEMRVAKVFVARLDDEMINPVTAQFLVNAIERAEQENGVAVLQIDTPGGLLQSTREIVKRQLTAKVPVIVYVAPQGSRAASAGVFITIAGHIAAMAPATNIGAAHVVDISGNWPTKERLLDNMTSGTFTPIPRPDLGPREVMSEKIMNDTLAWVEALAKFRGKNAAWAKDAVEKSLSVTAEKALELGVIDLIAEDLPDLLKKCNDRVVLLDHKKVKLRTTDAIPVFLELSQRERILSVLANPNFAVLLLLFGLLLLGYEVTHPGLWLPGVAGAVCLLLAAYALQMLPTNYAAFLLILLGVGLLIAEIKFTSYGLLTVAGAICLFFGALALFQQPKPFYGVTVWFIGPVVVSVTLLAAFLVFLVTKAHARHVTVGVESYAGKLAEVVVPLEPKGKVFFNGTYWDAEIVSGKAAKGAQVRVVRVEGIKLIVEPVAGAPENKNPF